MLREQSDERVRTIIERAAADTDAADGSPTRKVGDLYRSFMDEARVEELGLAPIADDLAADRRRSPALDDLFLTLGRLQREGGPGLFDFGVAPDAKNPEEYVLYLGQGGLGLPDESYYREERHAAILAAYLPHVARMLALAGIGDGSTDEDSPAARVVALETRLAGHHWDNVATRDAVKSYNPFGYDALEELAPNVSWDDFVDGLDAREAFEQVVVGQPSYLEGLSGAARRGHRIDDLKHWLAFHVVALRRAPADQGAGRRRVRLHRPGHLRAPREPRALEAWRLPRRGFDRRGRRPAVCRASTSRPRPRSGCSSWSANLVEAFRRSFEGLDWMGPQTREQALAKLASFTPKVGYPDRWRDYSALSHRRRPRRQRPPRQRVRARRQLDKLGGPIDRDEWLMLPQTVNAYYHPLMNEIVFPAGILQPPFFDLDADDAVNYGGIGAVIGHEIGHGFDDQGSRYDATGSAARLVDRGGPGPVRRAHPGPDRPVQQLSPIAAPDEKVNGALTVGENIGDLGGLAIGYSAYRIATEGEDAPELDGYTGPQRFFLGWAQVWSGKARTEEAKRLLAIDPHSPTEVRANAVRNCDEFHEAFGVAEGDGMWLAPEERVHIF